jgi:Tfp pilus assembly protein PilN
MARGPGLNLAARPYTNSRPVRRLSAILWVLGALLLAANVFLYWEFIAGREDTYEDLAQVRESIATEEALSNELARQLTGFELADQNIQVAFLNDRIAQRRFSWSRLFDDLSDLLPDDVRLTQLDPGTGDGGSRRRSNDPSWAQGRVLLSIEGRARNSEAILELVDALFTDPDFEQPRLDSETREESGLVRFRLETLYVAPALALGFVDEPGALVEAADTADGAPGGEGSGQRPVDQAAEPASAVLPAALSAVASSPPELRR